MLGGDVKFLPGIFIPHFINKPWNLPSLHQPTLRPLNFTAPSLPPPSHKTSLHPTHDGPMNLPTTILFYSGISPCSPQMSYIIPLYTSAQGFPPYLYHHHHIPPPLYNEVGISPPIFSFKWAMESFNTQAPL